MALYTAPSLSCAPGYTEHRLYYESLGCVEGKETSMKRAPIWDIGWIFLVTRILLIIVTYFGYILLTQEKYSGTAISIPTMIDTWQQWDAKIYVQIAHSGYQP